MAHHVIVRTPIPTASQMMDSMGISKTRRKRIDKLVSQVSFIRNSETGDIDVKLAKPRKSARKLKDAA